MDKDTHESLSARLNINNNFRLDEFPTEKQPIVIAYLFGALSANKEIRLNWEGKTYNIEERSWVEDCWGSTVVRFGCRYISLLDGTEQGCHRFYRRFE
jgi:hypothetical protein